MNLLLDSHVFISWHEEPSGLSKKVIEAISDPANNIYLSLASIWEIQIKIQIGKFKFVEAFADVIHIEQSRNNFITLPIKLEHVFALEHLPFHNKDPFDRLLISQALVEDLTLVSSDSQFPAYGVSLLW